MKREASPVSPPLPRATPTARIIRSTVDVVHALLAAEGQAYWLATTPEAQVLGLSGLLTDHARRNNAFAETLLRHLRSQGATAAQIDEALRGVRCAIQLEPDPYDSPGRSIAKSSAVERRLST